MTRRKTLDCTSTPVRFEKQVMILISQYATVEGEAGVGGEGGKGGDVPGCLTHSGPRTR